MFGYSHSVPKLSLALAVDVETDNISGCFPGGGGVLPILRYTCMCRADAPVLAIFLSLSVAKKCKFSFFVPQLNLIILSFIEEEISQ